MAKSSGSVANSHGSMSKPDEHWMREALREAQCAIAKGEVPIGAVVVYENQIIGRGHNQVEILRDATAHAEMIALTAAQNALADWRLDQCTIYVTKEPCPMCAGAIMHCRLSRLVYGASDPKLGAAGGALNIIGFQNWNHRCQVMGGVLADECRELLRSFFQSRRRGLDGSLAEGQ